jgi:hypothetical protein
MASRRDPVEDTAPVPEQNHSMGFSSSDLALPRMRVVGKDARLVELGIAKPCDIAIGADAEDPDSEVYPSPGNVTFMVLACHINLAMPYGKGEGSWDLGDPSAPDGAKKQYHYTLCVPDYDGILPVKFTASGGAAGKFRRINTLIAKHTEPSLGNRPPYELGFTLSTFMDSGTIDGNKKSWPAPVLGRTELTDEQLKIGAAMYESVVGTGRAQLTAGSGNDLADL